MSVHRSPPSLVSLTEQSQSQPDLSKISSIDTGIDQITLRKRKRPDTNDILRAEFKDFRQEMLCILKDFTQNQNNNMEKIAGDISSIKDQINNIQQKTDQIIIEHSKLKTEVAALKSNGKEIAQKVSSLETDMLDLKMSVASGSTGESGMSLTYEDMLQEVNERYVREKNLIFIGIPEPQCADQRERNISDTSEIIKLIKMTDANCPEPLSNSRLGKYTTDKVRPIKAIFSAATTVKEILKNQSKVSNSDVKIYSDKTLYQRKHMKNLKEELQTRIQNGEANLTIKYVKGTPKIVNAESKN